MLLLTAECGQRSGQTPRYPKGYAERYALAYAKRYPLGLPSGRAERLALEWGYPLGRRKTQGNAAQDRLRRFIYPRMGTAEYR